MADDPTRLYFDLFNEIGILSQLSGALLEAKLPEGMLVSHFTVLNHLMRVRDGATPLDLARAFQVPKTTMTHTLAGLQKRGLIEMRKNPGDGRSKQVWLTAAGRDLRNGTIAAMAPDMAGLAAVLPPDRVADLVPALRHLRQHLDAARDG